MFKRRLILLGIVTIICLNGCGKKEYQPSNDIRVTEKNIEDSKDKVNKVKDEPVFDMSKEESLKLLKKAYKDLKESDKNIAFMVATSKIDKEIVDELEGLNNIESLMGAVGNNKVLTEQVLGVINKDECYIMHIIPNNGVVDSSNLAEFINKDESYVEYYKDIGIGKGHIKCGFNESDFNARNNIEMIDTDNIIDSAMSSIKEFNLDMNNIEVLSNKLDEKLSIGDNYELVIKTLDNNERYGVVIQDDAIVMVLSFNDTATFGIFGNEATSFDSYCACIVECGMYSRYANNPISSEALTKLKTEFIDKNEKLKKAWEYGLRLEDSYKK